MDILALNTVERLGYSGFETLLKGLDILWLRTLLKGADNLASYTVERLGHTGFKHC